MSHIKSTLYGTLFFPLLIVTLAVLIPQTDLYAQNKSVLIRDSEIENILQEWLQPLKKAAGMPDNRINIILIQNPKINAFVAGGANIFFYTGLIEHTQTPGELIGVMAHELGHITGGHLIESGAALERASYESIVGMVVGVGAAILTRDAVAARAIFNGVNGLAASRYLYHSRVNESAADQAAFTYLEKSAINPSGLSSFLKKLESEQFLPASRQSEYVRTHPFIHSRIDALKTRLKTSAHIETKPPAQWIENHARMKAKILGYISPERVPWVYSDGDSSLAARYARTIAAYRQNNIDAALKGVRSLLQDEPHNPYFLELKGQMLVEFGRVRDALPFYKQSIQILPSAPLIRIAYAHAMIESKPSQAELQDAIDHLNIALKTERRNTQIHRLSAIAHGRLGHDNLAKLHLAEEALLQRRLSYAQSLAQHVQKQVDPSSASFIQAQDILSHIKILKKSSKN